VTNFSRLQFAVPAVLAGLAVNLFSAAPAIAEPETIPPHAYPSTFTPYVGATVSAGAKIALFLKRPGPTLLTVARFVDAPNASPLPPTDAPLPTPVGKVSLGALSAGVHVVPWNLQVNGTTLAAGNYEIDVTVAKNGVPLGLPEPVPYVLAIGTDGRMSTSLEIHRPYSNIVHLDGSIGSYNPPAASSSSTWALLGGVAGGAVIGIIGTALVLRRRTGGARG
jgi:hypothetical protein